ncbi:MAG: nucleotide-binding protein [Burkholderiales bacterium]|nr:nucleotide-binding protein [Burkholderiales bacterium]
MQSKRLVIDANILVRAVLGVRVRQLIERYCESAAFYVAESNVEEAMEYLADLAPRRGIPEQVWQASLTAIMTAVQIIPQVELAAAELQAMARIGKRDPADWPAVAGALQFDCPVWTEDEDFFGSGVVTWTTATVEIYLSGDSPARV